MRFSRRLIWSVCFLGCGALLGWVGPGQRQARDGVDLFRQVSELVGDEFIDSLTTSEVYERATRGLVTQLRDPYAALFSPAEQERYELRYGGKYGGIGVIFEELDTAVVARRIVPNSPAERSGVKVGDRIVTVDGRSVRDWRLGRVTGLLRGVAGTTVTIGLDRAAVSTPLELRLTRAVIHLPSVPYTLMIGDSVGYLPLQQFTETSASEVRMALTGLASKGARSLVLDLRGNGGGYTDQATEIANLFLAKGQDVYTERGRQNATRVVTTREPIAPTLPLVVLSDSLTASAAEIVAGALQDHDRALLMGERSFGKGLVQTARTLPNGWRLVMTTGRWLTPSGRSIQRTDRDVGSAGTIASPDGAAVDSAGRTLTFRSDHGRRLEGGGGITPDILLAPDTLDDGERPLARILGERSRETDQALRAMADSLGSTMNPDFTVVPSWREDFHRRMDRLGVAIERPVLEAGRQHLDQLIEYRLSQRVFGDSAAARRSLSRDQEVQRALALLARTLSQEQLLALATP